MRLAIGILVLLLAACGPTATPTPTTHLIQGSVALNDLDGFTSSGGTCSGNGGYSDLRSGTAVTIKNQTGTIIATSSLTGGSPSALACTFRFTILSVPDADFYSIEVSHRGGLSYSRADLETAGWSISLSIGD